MKRCVLVFQFYHQLIEVMAMVMVVVQMWL